MLSRINTDAGGNTPQGLLMDDLQLTSAIPEPATAALLVLGVAGLLGRRRREGPIVIVSRGAAGRRSAITYRH
jgi:hypothetical protein